MVRRTALVICICCLVCLLAVAAQAMDVHLYMDVAPNAYGSADYAAWRTAAFAAAANGTFVNMANGAHPGTTLFEADEAIVYSTGDLGKRLHWIYWIPGETIASLDRRFEAKDAFDWDGEALTLDDSYNFVADTADSGWFTPSSWINYDANGDGIVDGVIGTFGDAWWADDNLALPYSTNTNIYDETDADDVAALARQMRAYQTYWYGQVRFRDSVNDDWQTVKLRGNVDVPEPMSIFLGVMGLGSIVGYRRLRK